MENYYKWMSAIHKGSLYSAIRQPANEIINGLKPRSSDNSNIKSYINVKSLKLIILKNEIGGTFNL